MQHGRERLEDDTLLGVLQSVLLGTVLVLALHHLDRNVILERLLDVVEALDIELDVCEAAEGSASVLLPALDSPETNRSRARSEPTQSRR